MIFVVAFAKCKQKQYMREVMDAEIISEPLIGLLPLPPRVIRDVLKVPSAAIISVPPTFKPPPTILK